MIQSKASLNWVAQKLAIEICNASSTEEAYRQYCDYLPLLEDYNFILAATKGISLGPATNRTFSAGASVRGLFKTDQVTVLDASTVKGMEAGGASIPIDVSIFMDTNAISYLEPYIAGRNVPEDYKEVFDFIAREDVDVNPVLYIFENLPKLKNNDIKIAYGLYRTFKAYEVLRTLNIEAWQEQGEICSTSTPDELSRRACQHISRMYLDSSDEESMQELRFQHQLMYAYLAKLALIQITSPRKKLENKMSTFLEFSHSKLATMSVRNLILARAYFDHGQDMLFFKRVQAGRPESSKELSKMAWDMLHIKQLEKSLTSNISGEGRYFFPAFLTFDKAFIEVLDLFPLKSCAFKIDNSDVLPFYYADLVKLVSTEQARGEALLKRYISDEARAWREKNRKRAKMELSTTISQLEDELRAVDCIHT